MKGYPGAEYKKFKTRNEASEYIGTSCEKLELNSTPNVVNEFCTIPSGFFAVRRGFKVGVFTSWQECKQHVEGYQGAVFKKFASMEAANSYLIMEPMGEVLNDAITDNINPSNTVIKLTSKQYSAIKSIIKGDSLFISGAAGVGKSFLIQVVKDLFAVNPSLKREAAFTASTGCAACGIGGETLHSWAGVGIGLSSELTAAALHRKMDGRARRRWKETRLLLIDEVFIY